MRENMGLYRGKRKDTGEWVEGSLFVGFRKTYICPEAIAMYYYDGALCLGGFVEVDPETVGQFSGLTDKNGTKAFEGDIFKTSSEIGVIRFREDEVVFGLEIWWRGFPDDFDTFKAFGKPSFGIIGNIHDNPELLNPDHPELVEVSK